MLYKITKTINSTSKTRLRIYKINVFLAFCLFFMSLAQANPVLHDVASGNVTVQQSNNSTQINQTSQTAIMNWNSFNIGANETTHFQQPTGGIALNRINPQNGVSQIFGQLTATGKIILVNQAGIYFGSTARVDVGGIIASTVDITDQNFLAGKYSFDQPSGYSGSVINEGQIIAADHGLVALVGSSVSNTGLIQANLGSVVLASGNKFTVDLIGDQLINFTVDAPATSVGVDQNGRAMKYAVNQSGSIIANGGTILMTAGSAQGVLDNVINMSGVAQARSVTEANGQIILSGDKSTDVIVSGSIDASGTAKGLTGGVVKITGGHIRINSPTVIDVSGDASGGTILVGGNFHGAGPELNAWDTQVNSGVLLNANAITNGNGGQIAVWSNGMTQFYGNISAKGGAQGGNGGYVETSGETLDVNGASINLMAANGVKGTWLLDPNNIVIYGNGYSPTTPAATGSGTSGSPYTNSSGSTSYLSASTVQTGLASADVYIQTPSGAGNDITLDSTVGTLTWSTNSILHLTSGNNIYLNSGISAASGGLYLSAANSAQSITTSAAGTINVYNFNLLQGQWYQVSSTLPPFSVTNNFQLNSGTVPYSNVQFIRATGGSGTTGSPYVIKDIYGLAGIGSSTATLGYSYQLAQSIDASAAAGWTYTSGTGLFINAKNTGFTAYSGTFNGAGYTINNFAQTGTNAYGLFGYLTGTIKNLGLLNGSTSTTAAPYQGLLVGYNTGTITSSYATGTLTNSSSSATDAGGLVGYNDGTINTSYTNVLVVANHGNTSSNVGGFVGENDLNISDSYSLGTVIGSGYVGGFVGNNNGGTINRAFSIGYGTSTRGPGYVGGFAGNNSWTSGSINTSYWDTQTSGTTAGIRSGPVTVTGLTSPQLENGGSGTAYAAFNSGNPGAWGIISDHDTSLDNGTFPYLTAIYSSTPRIISGYVPLGWFNQGGYNGYNVVMLVNGSTFGTYQSAYDGMYYFTAANGAIPDNTPFIVYLTGSTKANIVGLASAGGASDVLEAMSANGIVAYGSTTTPITNTDLGIAEGASPSTNILFTVSGANLTLGNSVNKTAYFFTRASTSNNAGTVSTNNTNYTIDGTISSISGGSDYMSFGGATIVDTNSITTATGLFFGALTLNNNVTMNAGSGQVYFQSGISGTGESLSVAATGGIFFYIGNVGSSTNRLASLNVTGASSVRGVSIYTSGNQTYNGGVTLTGTPNTFDAGTGTVTFTSGISGSGKSLISLGSGNLIFDGSVGSSGSRLSSISVTGPATFNNGISIYTSGAQTYSGAVTLAGNTKFDAGAGTLTFGSTLSGSGYSLTSAGTGNLIFDGSIGSNVSRLSSISVTGPVTFNNGISLFTSNNQTYSGAATLGNNTTFDSSAGLVHFASTLNGISAGTDSLTITGNGEFDGIVGGTAALNALSVSGTTTIKANVTTTNSQNYANVVTLAGSPTLTTSANGTITLNGVSGPGYNLTLSGGSDFILNGSLNLNNISVTGGTGENNSLQVVTSTSNSWMITGANAGSITGTGQTGAFNFSQIQNLVGGGSGNDFIFTSNGLEQGTINGGSGNSTNTLDYSNYGIVSAEFNSTTSGTVQSGGQTVTTFSNINNIIGNNLGQDSLTTTPGTASTIYVISFGKGWINDPTDFSGFSNMNAQGATVIFTTPAIQINQNNYSINGSTMTFNNISHVSGNVVFATSASSTIPSASTTIPSVDVNTVITAVAPFNEVSPSEISTVYTNSTGDSIAGMMQLQIGLDRKIFKNTKFSLNCGI
ncbi:MAG: beta strand repeat-containing protein [Gammaproteobacteria bacterium]